MGGPSAQSIALPATVVVLGGVAALASKVDPEFNAFVDKASLRPSDVLGAGYETTLKARTGRASWP